MEKILNAIASRLDVRRTVAHQSDKLLNDVLTVTLSMFDRTEATDEVKELFKTEFNNHLFFELQKIEVGEYVDYIFDCGNVRPLGTLMEDANDNMAAVLLKLPPLEDGESYDFPRDTFIRFTLTEKKESNIKVKPSIVCTWIMEAYSNQ